MPTCRSNRANTVTEPFLVWIEDAAGEVIVSRLTRPIELRQGDVVHRRLTLTLPDDLTPGIYKVRAKIDRMLQGSAEAEATARLRR